MGGGRDFFQYDGEGFQVFVFHFSLDFFSFFVVQSEEAFQGGGEFSRFGNNIHP